MKKIIYLITKANFGGAQKYVFDLAHASQQEGFDVVVVYGEPGLLATKLQKRGIRSIAIPELGRDVRFGNDLRAFFAVRKLLMRERPDVIHLNSSKASVVGALAAHASGVRKIIFTAHGWAYNENRPLWQKVPFALLHYLCVLLSHKTICVSEAIRHDAAWMPFVKKKLVLIHNGVAHPDFTTREKAREFLSKNTVIPETLWVGTTAELHPNKRLDLLIEAFSRIATEFPDSALVIMGDGQEQTRLEELASRRGLDDRIHLLGHVSDAPRYLKALDIFVLPSHTEALSLSLLEAGMASLPCIASRVGGIPEIIDDGKNGLLVENGNSEQFTIALKKLLSLPEERQQFGTTLHEKVTREFSLERMVKQTIQLYSKESP